MIIKVIWYPNEIEYRGSRKMHFKAHCFFTKTNFFTFSYNVLFYVTWGILPKLHDSHLHRVKFKLNLLFLL